MNHVTSLSAIIYGAGLGLLLGAFATSVGVILATVWPARGKIVAALRGQGA